MSLLDFRINHLRWGNRSGFVPVMWGSRAGCSVRQWLKQQCVLPSVTPQNRHGWGLGAPSPSIDSWTCARWKDCILWKAATAIFLLPFNKVEAFGQAEHHLLEQSYRDCPWGAGGRCAQARQRIAILNIAILNRARGGYAHTKEAVWVGLLTTGPQRCTDSH